MRHLDRDFQEPAQRSERTIDLVVSNAERRMKEACQVLSRIQDLAGRLGFSAPKNAETNKPMPVPAGPLEKLMEIQAAVEDINAETSRLLNEIEKHI